MYNSLAYYKFTLQDAMRLWHPRLSEMYRLCADLDLVLRRINQGGNFENRMISRCCADASLCQIRHLESSSLRLVKSPKRRDLEQPRLR